jgi:siroheme synthase (precorrin-2 oxidase/ferrochelatase)
MTKDFDPMKAERPPREEVCRRLRERGDQHIGQYLINVVSNTDRFEKVMDSLSEDFSRKEVIEQLLWNMEADELLEAIKKFDEEARSK